VYALGDCAQIIDNAHPCTAQVAEKQGRYLAVAMGHSPTSDKPLPPPFGFKSWGMLAYVGGYKAIHDIKMDKSKGNVCAPTLYCVIMSMVCSLCSLGCGLQLRVWSAA
jgi:NADH dehydrogenase FAD-containing subunit